MERLRMAAAILAVARRLAEDGDVQVERSHAEQLPPRDDARKRYKPENIERNDRDDYRDTLFDSDTRKEK